MSSRGLTNMAKRMLKNVTVDMREQVLKYEGQIFIWDREQFKQDMAIHTTPEQLEELVKFYRTRLKNAEKIALRNKKISARLISAKRSIAEEGMEGYKPSTHEIFALKNYTSAVNAKTEVGAYFNKLTGKAAKLITGQIEKGDIAARAPGYQVGHGEFGHAVSTTKALSAEAAMKTQGSMRHASAQAYKNLEQAIRTYKETLNISLEVEHYQEVTSTGKLRKRYTPVLSSQRAGENQQDKNLEEEALRNLENAIRKEYQNLATQEGSETLVEAVESVVLSSLTKSKGVKYVGKSKPKSTVKSKSKSSKQRSKVERKVSGKVASGAGSTKPKTKATVSPASAPFAIFMMLNSQLPQTVMKNMRDPALINRSGRFAESVRITDVVTTPKGFPSVGYTYQKNPYQTFESGFRQGNVDRDPRALIDRSIRELAAKFAIGRFYTRRV